MTQANVTQANVTQLQAIQPQAKDTITVYLENPFLSRKFGFGYETQPDRNGCILPPSKPDYTGTINQVQARIENDRYLYALWSGGTRVYTAWFYDGQRIIGTNDYEYGGFGYWLESIEYDRFIVNKKAVTFPVTLILAERK